MDPNWFYGDDGSTAKAPATVLTVCDNCPVRLDCGQACAHEEQAEDPNVVHGIRAGMNAQTRVSLYRHMTRLGVR